MDMMDNQVLFKKLFNGSRLEERNCRIYGVWRDGPKGGVTKRIHLNYPMCREALRYVLKYMEDEIDSKK